MSNFFDDDDDDEVVAESSTDHNDSFFSESSPRAYNRPPAAQGRVSSIFGHTDHTSSSFRASSIASERPANRSFAGRSRATGSPSLEDILGEDAGPPERNIVKLIRYWSNEIAAPELLVFPRQLVERVTKDLARRRREVIEASGTDRDKPESFYVELALVATENLRASHVLKSYLRHRLHKVEKFARYYLNDMEDAQQRMYDNELAHATGYEALTNTYFKTAAVDAMPEKIAARLHNPQLFPSPDLAQAVFTRARRNCPVVVLPDGTTIAFEKGSQHLVRYSTVRELLRLDHVELV